MLEMQKLEIKTLTDRMAHWEGVKQVAKQDWVTKGKSINTFQDTVYSDHLPEEIAAIKEKSRQKVAEINKIALTDYN